MTTKFIEQVIYGQEILKDMSKTLISYYTSQYGKKKKELIEHRINHTFYLMSSTPDLVYEELKDFNNHFKSQIQYDNMITEYLDYIKINKELEKMKIMNIRRLLCKEYGISEAVLNKKDIPIEELSLSSYSSDVINILNSPYTLDDMKNQIHKSQQKYFTQCNNLGCKPITDTHIIDSILDKMKVIETEYQISLLKKTLWGQRLFRYFTKNNGISENDLKQANLEDLLYRMLQQDIFLQNGQMQCVHFYIEQNNIETINNWIISPILENKGLDLNHNFYHEIRHAIENGGIDYNVINELRTDKHAYEDKHILPQLFDNNGECQSVYLQLLPLSGNLFNTFESFFDEIAINNDTDKLESIVSKDTLTEYNNMLNNILSLMINPNVPNIYLEINSKPYKEKCNQISKSLKKHLQKNS